MFNHARISFSLAAALALTACGTVATLPTADQAPTRSAKAAAIVAATLATAPAAVKPVLTDLGHKNGAALIVSIAKARSKFKLQAIQHRWQTADIQHYMVSLFELNADGSTTAVHEAVKVEAQGAASPLAAFTGLEPNKTYRIKLDAYGANAAAEHTTMLQQMNLLDQTNHVDFDFHENAAGNIEDSLVKTVAVSLDPFPFEGNASANVTVNEGQFTSKSRPTFVRNDRNNSFYKEGSTIAWSIPLPTSFTSVDSLDWLGTSAGFTLDTFSNGLYAIIRRDGTPWWGLNATETGSIDTTWQDQNEGGSAHTYTYSFYAPHWDGTYSEYCYDDYYAGYTCYQYENWKHYEGPVVATFTK